MRLDTQMTNVWSPPASRINWLGRPGDQHWSSGLSVFHRILGGLAAVIATFAIYSSSCAAWADGVAKKGNLIQAIRLAPGNATYWIDLANTKELQEPGAEDALDRARKLNPHDWALWIQSGLRAEARGELAQAEAFLLHAESLSRQCRPQSILAKHFYEKVVKVKADVAAIFIVSPARFPKSRLTIWTRPRWHHRGDAQGGFQRSALKPPLRGEPRHRCVPAPLAGT